MHRATEALAVFVLAPMQIWVGLQKRYDLPMWFRASSIAFGVGTIVVDGGLLLRFWKAKRAGGCAPYDAQEKAAT